MMAQSADTEDQQCRRVITRSIQRLQKNMIPDDIIDCSTGFELFSFRDRRNIKVCHLIYVIYCHNASLHE